MRQATLVIAMLGLLACAGPTTVRPRPAGAPTPSVPAPVVLTAPRVRDAAWLARPGPVLIYAHDAPARPWSSADAVTLPGCTEAEHASVAVRIESLRRRFVVVRVSDRAALRAGTPEDADARAAIAAVWRSPCLAHVARFFPPPSHGSFEELHMLWSAGLGEVLAASNGGLPTHNGARYFLIPPSLPDPIDANTRAALTPWLCPPGARCGQVGSYVARAEHGWDRDEEQHGWWRTAPHDYPCGNAQDLRPDEEAVKTPFEAWAECIVATTARSHRYAPLGFRAPERGWLVLRGRRGHYSFADEIRAYDLATGAAWVATSASALVLAGTEVDVAASDAQRKPEVYAGKVSRDEVREIAFVLLTAKAVRSIRSEARIKILPPEVELSLTRGSIASVEPQPFEWRSSAQTELAWTLVDEGRVLAKGSLTWSGSADAAQQHAADLVKVLEAGLERGCAPAKLPTGIVRGASGWVSPIDARPDAQRVVFGRLADALEALRDVCKDKDAP